MFICQRPIWTKVSAIDQKMWGCGHKTLKQPQCIYRIFKQSEWYLQYFYNPNKNQKVLIVFDDIVVDLNTNKKF